MANLKNFIKRNSGTIGLLFAISSLMPIPFTWFGFKEIEFENRSYTIKRTKDKTIIIDNPYAYGEGPFSFYEYRIDKNNDGILDQKYFRSVFNNPKHGPIIFSRAITDEDQMLYRNLVNVYNKQP